MHTDVLGAVLSAALTSPLTPPVVDAAALGVAPPSPPADARAPGLRGADWAVLAAYVALLVGAGWWANRAAKVKSARDYFLAGRHMPVWAIAVSMLATAQSAATFVGVPQDAYAGNLAYLSANIGGVLAAVIVAWAFIPRYYRLGVATPYELLETRFGPGARQATTWAYLVGRVFASGSRLFVGAIPVTLALFGERTPTTMALVIGAFVVFGVLYTLRGGLESAVWTDIVQVGVYVGAALVTIGVLLWLIPASPAEILGALREGGLPTAPPEGGAAAAGAGPATGAVGSSPGASKLSFLALGVDTSRPLLFDPALPFTLLTALTGWTLLNMAAYGTDQDLTQRLLSCRSAAQGTRSTLASVLVGLPVVLVFATVGLLLWVFYQRPDIMGRPAPAYVAGDSADVFLKFALREMPAGAAGLVIAGVLAAGPAGLNASLNSMSGAFVNDVYRRVLRPGRDDRHYVVVGRCAAAVCGVVLGAFALLCVWWQRHSGENLITFVLGVMTFAYAGLLGVFLTALFTRRGNSASAVAGLLAGFVTVLVLQPMVWREVVALNAWTQAHLAPVIAAPWRLVLGTTVATLVCCAGRGRGRTRAIGGGSDGGGGAPAAPSPSAAPNAMEAAS